MQVGSSYWCSRKYWPGVGVNTIEGNTGGGVVVIMVVDVIVS